MLRIILTFLVAQTSHSLRVTMETSDYELASLSETPSAHSWSADTVNDLFGDDASLTSEQRDIVMYIANLDETENRTELQKMCALKICGRPIPFLRLEGLCCGWCPGVNNPACGPRAAGQFLGEGLCSRPKRHEVKTQYGIPLGYADAIIKCKKKCLEDPTGKCSFIGVQTLQNVDRSKRWTTRYSSACFMYKDSVGDKGAFSCTKKEGRFVSPWSVASGTYRMKGR